MMVSEPEEQEWEKKNAPLLAAAEREKMKSATGRQKAESALWIAYYDGMVESLPDLKLTLPDITFSDSLWIYGKQRNVKLIEYQNGHTRSDVVLFVPDEKIAFMGDLFFVQRHPWIGDGDPRQWHKLLQAFEEDSSVETLVPGHGPISDKKELQPLQDYISDVQAFVEARFKEGLPDSVILKAEVPAKYWSGGLDVFIFIISDRFPDDCEKARPISHVVPQIVESGQ